jgi:hypothetical protein
MTVAKLVDMNGDDTPPIEAILALMAMLATWPLVMRMLYSYKFDTESVRVYFLGIRVARIPVQEIEWMRITTWFDVLAGNVPYPPQKLRTRIVANSFFRKLVMIKTKQNFFWCVSPKNPEVAIQSLQPGDQRRS